MHQAEHAVDAATGHAPGGRMKQEICDDHYGLDAWDQRHGSRCFVSLRNSVQWTAVAGSGELLGPADVAQQAKATGQKPLPDNETIAAAPAIALGKPIRVRENTVAGAPG